MEYKPTGKTYKLKTYEDFMQLTKEQFEMMLPDFQEWKNVCDNLKKVSDYFVQHGIQSEPIILPDHFEWIDDGLSNGNVTLSIIDKDNPDLSVTAEIKKPRPDNIVEFELHTVVVNCGDGSATTRIMRNLEDAQRYSDYEDAAGTVYGGFAEPGLETQKLKINLTTGEIENPDYEKDDIEDLIKEFLEDQDAESLEDFM